MDTKINVTARPNGTEARFADMIGSASFALLLARIEAELARAQHGCERGVGSIEVRRAQGAVAALRTVLGLPAVLLAEIKLKAEG